MACNNSHSPNDARVSLATTKSSQSPPTPQPPTVDKKRFEELDKEMRKRDPNWKGIEQERRNILDARGPEHNKYMQRIGEMTVAPKILSNFGFNHPVSFVGAKHGFDCVALSSNFKVAFAEAKTYAKMPGKTEGLPQLSQQKCEKQIEKMRREKGSLRGGDNSFLALTASLNGYERYLIHIGYEQQAVRVSRVADGLNGEPVIAEVVYEGHVKDVAGTGFEVYFEAGATDSKSA